MKKTALLLTAILAFSAVTLYAQSAQNRIDNGKKLVSQGDFDGAMREFNEAIKLAPKNAMAYVMRGGVYAMKEDYDRAIADNTEAIRLDPKNATAYFARGTSYGMKGDNDRAIADYTEAIRLTPKDAMAYFMRGSIYYEKKDYDRAIADYNEAIRLDPKDEDMYYDRGKAYYYKKDFDRAIADFEAALRIEPNHTNAKKSLDIAKREAAKKNDSSQSSTGVISVTAKDLYSAYNSNRFRADSQYKDKTVKVTGKITQIERQVYGEFIGNYFIVLDLWVWVYIKPSEINKIISLDKGQTVTLTGICDGFSHWVEVKDGIFSN